MNRRDFVMYARAACGSCPAVGLGVKMYYSINRSDITFKLIFMSAFLLEVITLVPFMLGSCIFVFSDAVCIFTTFWAY